MVEIMQPYKVVLVTHGRYAGKKAVIVKAVEKRISTALLDKIYYYYFIFYQKAVATRILAMQLLLESHVLHSKFQKACQKAKFISVLA
jgi:hypothetical protein